MKKPVVICVDDEPIVLESLKVELAMALENTCLIETSDSGADALELVSELQAEGYDIAVVISDYLMPHLKGDELLKQIHHLLPKTLKIMLTGQAGLEAVGNAIKYARLYRYIAKPWQTDDLKLTVNEAIRSYLQTKKVEEQNNKLKTMYLALEKSFDELAELNKAYSRFVPNEYLNFLNKTSITEVQLGDHVSKEMAIMFSDIRSFTTMSEKMTPQENFDFINAYLKQVSPEIRNNNGFIVKYLGDGMMAIFPNGVDDAVKAGINKLQQVTNYNQQLSQQGYSPIGIGIGIHIGPMMVGMVGETNRMQGDAFSDIVNLTARLESLSKLYGVSLVISQETLNQLNNLKQYNIRLLDKVIVKGRSNPIVIYEVLNGLPNTEITLKQQTQADFEQAIQHYQQGNFSMAQTYFKSVLTTNPKDKATTTYLLRIEKLLKQNKIDNWNGVWHLEDK